MFLELNDIEKGKGHTKTNKQKTRLLPQEIVDPPLHVLRLLLQTHSKKGGRH